MNILTAILLLLLCGCAARIQTVAPVQTSAGQQVTGHPVLPDERETGGTPVPQSPSMPAEVVPPAVPIPAMPIVPPGLVMSPISRAQALVVLPPPGNATPVVLLSTAPAAVSWTPSLDPTVASYTLYYGTLPRSYGFEISGTNALAAVTNLIVGQKYYFATTATATNGLEGEFSDEVSYVAPQWLRATFLLPGGSPWIQSSADLQQWQSRLDALNVTNTPQKTVWDIPLHGGGTEFFRATE